MLYLNRNTLPEFPPHEIEDRDLRRRAKYLLRCKAAVWKHWSQEYLRSLRERHQNLLGAKGAVPVVGDVLLYAYSLTRGICVDLLPSLELTKFILSLQRFIARKGRPDRIYSDNGVTFIGAARWMRIVAREERIQNFLSVHQITWQFTLGMLKMTSNSLS